MSFAIIKTGGKQSHVEKGAKVRVPSLQGEVGSSVELDVLATAEKIGAPIVEGTESNGDGRRTWARCENRRL
jgi:ribosomal protein L21